MRCVCESVVYIILGVVCLSLSHSLRFQQLQFLFGGGTVFSAWVGRFSLSIHFLVISLIIRNGFLSVSLLCLSFYHSRGACRCTCVLYAHGHIAQNLSLAPWLEIHVNFLQVSSTLCILLLFLLFHLRLNDCTLASVDESVFIHVPGWRMTAKLKR